MAHERRHIGLGLALGTVLACADEGRLFVDLDLLPEDVRLVALLPLDEGGALRSGTGLLDREFVPLEQTLELDGATRALLVGYREEFVRPLPDPERLAASPVRPSGGNDLDLPAPAWSRLGVIEDGELRSLTEVDPGRISADWVECPDGIGDGGFVMPSCLNCVSTLKQDGCRLEADLEPCSLEGLELTLGPEGAISSLRTRDPRLGTCTLHDSASALASIECDFPERAGGCSLTLLPRARPDSFEILKLADVAPSGTPYAGARHASGYLFGGAVVGPELVLATSGFSPQPWACGLEFMATESRIMYVDRDTFAVSRTATAAPCLRLPLSDLSGDGGFLATYLEGEVLRFGRFDASARSSASVPLGSFLTWSVSEAVVLSSDRAVIVLHDISEGQRSRIVFVHTGRDGLSIERDHESTAVLITGVSRISDRAVAILADASDNLRIVEPEGERAQYFFGGTCGTTNLVSAGFWMSQDERFAVGAFRENGMLLRVEPALDRCEFVRAPIHPETHDPVAIAQMGNELIVSFWARQSPRAVALGRLDLQGGHMLPAFTMVGPGVLNRLVVDGDVVYGTITDRAELVRLHPQR